MTPPPNTSADLATQEEPECRSRAPLTLDETVVVLSVLDNAQDRLSKLTTRQIRSAWRAVRTEMRSQPLRYTRTFSWIAAQFSRHEDITRAMSDYTNLIDVAVLAACRSGGADASV